MIKMSVIKWISVKDRLPIFSEYVWIKTSDIEWIQLSRYMKDGFRDVQSSKHIRHYENVEYWTELIPPLFL
jgi:hypothetical protein